MTFSNIVSIMPDSIPGVPIPPTITVNSNTGVTINWVPPQNIGSVITAYTVAIRASDGTMFAL
jgi:hypothetical protein